MVYKITKARIRRLCSPSLISVRTSMYLKVGHFKAIKENALNSTSNYIMQLHA